MLVMPDPVRAILGLLFIVTGGFTIFSRLWLFGRMKSHVPGLSFTFATTFFYLEAKYWENREKLRAHGLGRAALVVFLSPLAFLGTCLALYLIRG
jgi:hypothetical protein